MDQTVRRFSLSERIKISILSRLGYWAIALLGGSVRWKLVGPDSVREIHEAGARAIYTCWHGRIFPATWYWRNRGIAVMTSLNFDGEIIAGCIQRHGYRAPRGSSSRAGAQALAEMVRDVRNGYDVGFTIDGPHGPRHVAKQGPVIIARKTGAGIFCFHIAMRHRIQFNSWDHFQVPLPLTRAIVLQAPPIWVPADANEAEVREFHQQMQQVLDGLRDRGDRWERTGSLDS